MQIIKRAAACALAVAAMCAPASALPFEDIKVRVPTKDDVPMTDSDYESEHNSAMQEGAAINKGEYETLNIYSSQYRVNDWDQWPAWVRRYAAVKKNDGTTQMTQQGELNSMIESKRFSAKRSLKYWSPSEKQFVPLDADGDLTEFVELTKIDESWAKVISTDGQTVIPWETSGDWTPGRAFVKWLEGYDVSYEAIRAGSADSELQLDRYHMLPDLGQSGMILVESPDIVNSLPGYLEWSNENQSRERRLYVQTNDGLLHVIDPKTMQEESALILPPMLLPHRLAMTKFDERGVWMDVIGEATNKPGDIRSRPVYLMDGPMQFRHYNLKGTDNKDDWGTYLIGTLGRGGAGLYMLDVSTPSDPKFMWYRETISNYDPADPDNIAVNVSVINWQKDTNLNDILVEQKDIRWEALNSEVDNDTPHWRWLGYNTPKPACAVVGEGKKDDGTVDLRNVIIVGGGTKSKVIPFSPGTDVFAEKHEGTEGAAIYVLDAETGEILRMFNSRSKAENDEYFNATMGNYTGPDGVTHVGGNIGLSMASMSMIVSEPTLFRSDKSRYITQNAFLCSRGGTIFMIQFGGSKCDDSCFKDSCSKPDHWSMSLMGGFNTAEAFGFLGAAWAMPYGVAITRVADTKEIWVAGATADILSRTDMGGEGDLINNYQAMFSFNTSVAKDEWGLAVDDDKLTTYNSSWQWKELKTSADDDILREGDTTVAKTPFFDIESEATGWYSKFDEAKDDYEREYSTTRVLVVRKNVMLVATYLPGKNGAYGKSRLYAVNVATGAPMLWKDSQWKYREFNGIKISGMTLSENGGRTSVFVSYDRVTDDGTGRSEVNTAAADETTMQSLGDDVDAFVLDFGSNTSDALTGVDTVVEYWIEK